MATGGSFVVAMWLMAQVTVDRADARYEFRQHEEWRPGCSPRTRRRPSATRAAPSCTAIAYRHQLAPDTDNAGTVRAISAETGATMWLHEQRAATMSLVATGGGLVFGGDVNGRFRAFDHETGEILWEINLGSAVTGFPITYAVDGRQFVAVSTGSGGTSSHFTGLTLELRPSAGNNLFVFALP